MPHVKDRSLLIATIIVAVISIIAIIAAARYLR